MFSLPSTTSILAANQGKKYKESCASSGAGTVVKWVIIPHHPAVGRATSAD